MVNQSVKVFNRVYQSAMIVIESFKFCSAFIVDSTLKYEPRRCTPTYTSWSARVMFSKMKLVSHIYILLSFLPKFLAFKDVLCLSRHILYVQCLLRFTQNSNSQMWLVSGYALFPGSTCLLFFYSVHFPPTLQFAKECLDIHFNLKDKQIQSLISVQLLPF